MKEDFSKLLDQLEKAANTEDQESLEIIEKDIHQISSKITDGIKSSPESNYDFKNLDLQKDIEAKNRELGMSAMNLVKRNELLGHIKKELSTAKNIEDISKVIKLINRNLNTNDDWKLFEEAFNTADKDFIKKLKTLHSNLTSNDLRLCTYLRLNLSSKEIAPLLNISLRSVEVKRYRLRKKMNLPHEASLTDYILAL